MNKYYKGMIEDVKQNYKIKDNSSLEELIVTFKYFIAENQELKKQLEDTNEELELVRCDLHNRTSERNGAEERNDIYKNQQKEFIDYLENNIKKYEDKLEKCPFMSGMLTLPISFWKDELSKFKEIIGVSK